MQKIIAIANQKSGVGKTTTAVNLAALCALAGKSSLLIDMDPQANATSNLGVMRDSARNIGQCLVSGLPIEEAIVKTAVDRLCLVPGHSSLARVEQELAAMADPISLLRPLIQAVRPKYDVIFIDCPPSQGLLPKNALGCADGVLVPIQCEFFAMEGLSQMLGAIESAQKTVNDSLGLDGILFTMYDDGLQHSREIVEEIRKHFPDKTYRAIIPRDITVAEAASFGLPLIMYQSRSRAARGYIELAREVLRECRQPETRPRL